MQSVVFTLIVTLAGGASSALAGDGSIAGSFAVNNDLPSGWDLSTVVMEEGSTDVLASQAVTSDGSSIAFSFADLDPGSYRVRLLAIKEDTVLGLGETAVLEVSAGRSEPLDGVWKAMGSSGAVSGEIELSGQAREGRMILIRVRRVDIDVEGKFPDQLNAFTVEVQPEELEAGRVAYEVSGLSYGLFAVELIAYDYESHTTEPIDTYTERLVIDLDNEEHQDIGFTAEF
jgi:hypothetical protein